MFLVPIGVILATLAWLIGGAAWEHYCAARWVRQIRRELHIDIDVRVTK